MGAHIFAQGIRSEKICSTRTSGLTRNHSAARISEWKPTSASGVSAGPNCLINSAIVVFRLPTQFVRPVEHHVQLSRRRFLLACLNHQEPLPVRADVIVCQKRLGACLVVLFE